jgi:tetratricopeptide (TPR) repeat protein
MNAELAQADGRAGTGRLRRARARGRLASLLGPAACLLLAGCAGLAEPARLPLTGDPVQDARIQLEAAPARDRILWEYRLGLAALRAGDYPTARATFDSAIAAIGGIRTADSGTRRARSLFGSEEEKTFIGEPYERILAFYYRAILYWMDGEPDNARACYRTGQLLDTDIENGAEQPDWAILDHLEGLATAQLGGDARPLLERARTKARLSQPGDPEPGANLLVFAEFGRGPIKFAAGEHGERLRFREGRSRIRSAVLRVDGREIVLNPIEDIHWQATTRGGRVMDHILRGKAVFKDTSSGVGDAALLAGAGVLAAGDGGEGNRNLGAGLLAAGLVSKLISAAASPTADTRTWSSLPQFLSVASLRIAPGEQIATVEYYTQAGARIDAFTETRTLQVPASGSHVVFLSRPD